MKGREWFKAPLPLGDITAAFSGAENTAFASELPLLLRCALAAALAPYSAALAAIRAAARARCSGEGAVGEGGIYNWPSLEVGPIERGLPTVTGLARSSS